MKKSILSVMVGAIVLLLGGCANSSAVKPIKVDLGIKKEDMKIYVDNTLDRDKQKRVRDAFVYALEKMVSNNEFKIEKTPGYIGEDDWEFVGLRSDRTVKYHTNGKKSWYSTLPEENVNVYNFSTFHYVNLYNFIFNKNQNLSNIGFTTTSTFYKNKRDFKIIPIDNNSFEVKGFKTKKEALDIYLQLIRNCSENDYYGDGILEVYMKEYMKQHTDVGIDWTANLYYANAILYDPLELAKNNKLILKPTILESSKKTQLKSLLKQKKYIIVDNPKNANVIISVQNLAFGSIGSIDKDSKIINNRFKSNNVKIINPSQIAAEYSLASASFSKISGSTASTVAGVSAAIGALNLFSTTKHKITSIDFVNIFINGENKYNFITSTKNYAIEQKNSVRFGLEKEVDILNYAVSQEILKKLLY